MSIANPRFGQDKGYTRKWLQYINRIPCNGLWIKSYKPKGIREQGRPFKILLDVCDRNGLTNGPTPHQLDDNDDLLRLYSTGED